MTNLILATLLLTNHVDPDRLANAIYVAEGGSKTRYPYGIMSVKTSNPRHVCLVTITNNAVRWVQSGKTNSFVEFLGDRFCPKSVDPIGNVNWKRNVKWIYGRRNLN